MKYYWYDHNAKGKQKPQLSGLDDLASKFEASPGTLPRNFVNSVCYFVHYGDGEKESWEKIADVDRKSFVAFVSSQPYSLMSEKEGVFCIKDDLSRVADRLTSERIKNFTTTCEVGNPDWSVFQESFPEHLVAAYLLQIAKCEKFNVEMNKSFWDKASREFSQILGKGNQHVKLSADNGQQDLKKLFAELSKAK